MSFFPYQDKLHAVYFSLIIGLVIKILLSITSCLNNGWPSVSTFVFTFRTLESITLEEIFYGEFRSLSYLHSCYNLFSFIKQIIQGLSHKVHQILRYYLWVKGTITMYTRLSTITNFIMKHSGYFRFPHHKFWLFIVKSVHILYVTGTFISLICSTECQFSCPCQMC
jgi:hypothetical protein